QSMLQAWTNAGIQVNRLVENLPQATHVRYACAPSAEQEWQWAVEWAYEQLQHHPQGRYAILAPQLESQAPLAHRLLYGKLANQGLAYNIAVARPLAEWPMVRAALGWLSVMAELIDDGVCSPATVGPTLVA